MKDPDEVVGQIIRDTTDSFHRTIKEDRKRWCKEHGKSCRDCQIECEVKEVG